MLVSFDAKGVLAVLQTRGKGPTSSFFLSTFSWAIFPREYKDIRPRLPPLITRYWSIVATARFFRIPIWWHERTKVTDFGSTLMRMSVCLSERRHKQLTGLPATVNARLPDTTLLLSSRLTDRDRINRFNWQTYTRTDVHRDHNHNQKILLAMYP